MASCSFPFKVDQASSSATQQAVELQEAYSLFPDNKLALSDQLMIKIIEISL
jgi:hypothetical protein